MSAKQVLLTAARTLADQGFEPFTAGQLVVVAWGLDQKTFGLEGYETKHPDTNKVLSYVYGANGLVHTGYFKRTGVRRFNFVQTMADRSPGPRVSQKPRPPAKLGAAVSRAYTALSRSNVFRRAAGNLYGFTGREEALAFVTDYKAFRGRLSATIPADGYRLSEWKHKTVSKNRYEKLTGETIEPAHIDRLRQVAQTYADKFLSEKETLS